MKLSNKNVWVNNSNWQDAKVNLPTFNYETVKKETYDNPTWIHFGAGNIFRAFQCAVHQDLLNKGITNTGIIVAEGYDYEIIDKVYRPNDNNGLLVTLKVNGETEMTVISSVMESLTIDQSNTEDFTRLREIFANPSLQMVSFTITEKGYNTTNLAGEFYPDIQKDISGPIEEANSYLGKLVSLLHTRFIKGATPLALVSMDNVSHNGDYLKKAVLDLAQAWLDKGAVSEDFVAYLSNPDKVSYPWSMIDKITPRPDDSVKKMLIDLGFEEAEPIVTTKGTFIAPFVNAEEAQYLVIEDHFPNGRPPLDQAGVIFTSRETVDKVETMKVTTCLNPLHTALAVYGCLLGFTKISDEMKDEDLVTLISKIGYDEGLPVVVNPGILDPKKFIDEVIEVRFPNPFMPDTPQRIATDTSQKLSIRFLETIKSYLADETKDVNDLVLIPLVIAGWIRYLLAVDDEGNAFELSADPMFEVVLPVVAGIELGDGKDHSEAVKTILNNDKIFSINLYEAGLGQRIEGYFAELVAGQGAVRKTLSKYVGK